MSLFNSRIQQQLSQPKIGSLLSLYLLVWVASHLVSDTNLDPYGDMLENLAWGQTFSWGELKHPPLVGWIAGAWFEIFPSNHLSYHLLSYGVAAVGLAGIYVLAGQLGLERIRLSATLLMGLALPYSTLAIKFNANTILLPLWPWLVVLWRMSYTNSTRWPWLVAAALGTLMALSMLGKYFSGVLLLSLGLITLFTREGRAWLKQPYPWFAGAVGALLLVPHGLWLMDNNFATFSYVSEQGDGGVDYKQLMKFALAPLAYWLLAWMAVLVAVPGWSFHWLWKSWMPQGLDDQLFWITWLPFLITLGFGATGFVSLSLPWAIPLGFGFTLYWLRNLTLLTDTAAVGSLEERMDHRSRKLYMGFLVLVLLASPLYAWQQSKDGNENYYLPMHESIITAQLMWDEKFDQRYEWIGGDFPKTAAFLFYGGDDAELLSELPRHPMANGLIFCPMGPTVDKPIYTSCSLAADDWTRLREDQVTKVEFVVAKSGPRFIQDIPFSYRLYFYEHNTVDRPAQ